jgi:hypothetical protein
MTNDNPSPDRGLVWIVQLSSALSLGVLAALLYSVKAVNPQIQFQPSFATAVAFALAAADSFLFWHVVFQLTGEGANGLDAHNRPRKIRLGVLAASLALGLLVAFVYPLKDFSREKVSEIGLGAIIAVLFLSLLGLLFWQVVRFLERDARSTRD